MTKIFVGLFLMNVEHFVISERSRKQTRVYEISGRIFEQKPMNNGFFFESSAELLSLSLGARFTFGSGSTIILT